MGWILMTLTYLSGAAYGPNVAMGTFETQELCLAGGKSLMGMNAEMMKTNIAGGRTQRDVIFAKCVPATTRAKASAANKDENTLKN